MTTTNRSLPEATVIPVLAYPDVVEATDWLCNASRSKVRLRIGSTSLSSLLALRCHRHERQHW